MKDINGFLKSFDYYFVDFFMSVIVGLGIVILLNIPMKFMRVINIDLGAFIVHLLSMCITLWIRSYSRGYYKNTRTYTFQIKRVFLLVGMTFAAQILLTIIIGHTVYFTGPTCWLARYMLSIKKLGMPEAQSVLSGYGWLFMVLSEVFIYAPIMITAEYFGAKRNLKENTYTEDIIC